MLDFKILFSGSSGNCCLLYNNNTNILIDFGKSTKSINDALLQLNIDPLSIDAILITHEHEDHIKGLKNVSKYFSCPIFCLKKCLDYIFLNKKYCNGAVFKILRNSIKIKDININCFNTSHDSLDSCGFSFSDDENKISYVTDLGIFDDLVFNSIKGSQKVVIESNYDEQLILFSNYPSFLKKRINCDTGHLSNEQCAKAIYKLALAGTYDFTLAHISEKNNSRDLALETSKSIFYNTDLENKVKISIACKDIIKQKVVKIIH